MSFTLQHTIRTAARTASPSLRLLASGSSALGKRGIATKRENVVKHLKENDFFKDVISEFSPKVQLNARFLSSGTETTFGNDIGPVDAQGKPSIEIVPFPDEDGLPKDLVGKNAVIVMTDPDAPSRDNPEWSEFCHWIASIKLPSDGKGGEVVMNDSENVKQIMEYTAPAPPEGTGKHRYLLLLLEGDAKNAEAPSDRKKWGGSEQRTGIKQWAERNGLKPIGANFFFSEHKEQQSVDDLHDEKRGLGPSGDGYGG